MSFEVTVTPTVYNVEVEVNPSVQPFDVQVITQQDLADLVDEAKQYAEDAEDSADSASASASSASASASASASSANSASASASSASSSANTATTQAGIATTQAGIATTQAGIATTKAQEASQSANDALASEQASAQSASDALQSEQNALASEQASALSEANALASEQSASASASTATAQAGIATTQAGIATTQAGNALTSANNALNSANAAAASAASASAVGTSTLLTGFATGSNTTIEGTDTILGAFQKAQGQINARVSGTGASGQVAFWSGTGTQTGDSGLTWDNVNKGVSLLSQSTPANRGVTISQYSTTAGGLIRFLKARGTLASPLNVALGDIIGSISFLSRIDGAMVYRSGFGSTMTSTTGHSLFFTAGTLNDSLTANLLIHHNGFVGINLGGSVIGTLVAPTQTLDVNGTGRIRNGVSLADTSGNVQIGTTTDAGFRLDVNGTARIQSNLTVTATNATGDFATIDGSNILRRRTAAQVLADIAGIGGAVTSGQVAFGSAVNTIKGNSNFTYDEINTTLLIAGTTRPYLSLRTSTTGLTGTDGTRIGFTNVNGTFEINQFENLPIELRTNNILRWSILATGQFQSNGAQTIETSTGDLTIATNGGNGNIVLNPNGSGTVSITDAKDIALGTTTGTKIGTATSQKLAFWNATPIVQPTTSVAGATRVGGGGTTLTDTDTFDGYTLAQIVKALRNMGALA